MCRKHSYLGKLISVWVLLLLQSSSAKVHFYPCQLIWHLQYSLFANVKIENYALKMTAMFRKDRVQGGKFTMCSIVELLEIG